MWANLALFIGRLLVEILPALFKQGERTRKVKNVGGDEKVRQDISDQIDKDLQ